MIQVKYRIPKSLNDFSFNPSEPVFADIETEKLYIGTRLVQLYQPGQNDDEVIILDTDIIPEADIKAFIKPMWTVWFNASYDFGTLNMTTDKFDDIFYLARLGFPFFKEYNLDKVIENLGFAGLYDGLDKKKLQKAGFVKGAYLSASQLKYSATDVVALSLLWQNETIQKWRNSIAYQVDILSLKYAIVYQQNGIMVDLPLRAKYEKEVDEDIVRLTKELPEGFNVNSPKQVKAYLGTESSDYDTLVNYSVSDKPLAEKAHTIIYMRKALKEKGYLQSINHQYMLTRFNVAGAITGRFTSSGGDLPNGFNSQQIPRRLQPLFKPETEDTKVVGLDYSTLELRIAASVFGEPVMYQELLNGEDLHTNMAALATGKKVHPDGPLGDDYDALFTGDKTKGEYVTKKDRTLAKALNFGYIYGMSAKTYQNYSLTRYALKISLDEATKLRNLYFGKYKAIKKYHDEVWKNVGKANYIYTTALGRSVHPKIGTDAINGPIQGSGSETTKLAVHYLCKEYPEALKLIFNVVHDAIYLRVPKADYDLWHERVSKAMVKGWEEICKTSIFKYKDIPMPVGD